jgi:glutaminyl-peptide cyclotransferase
MSKVRHKPLAASPKSATDSPAPPKKLSGQTLFLWGSVVVSVLGLSALAFVVFGGKLFAADSTLKLENIPFNGTQAYGYLKQLCDLGPRRSGSDAMLKQQEFLKAYFEKLNAKVEFQRFKAPYPADGPDEALIGHNVPMANMIVRFGPETKERIMLCGHYDTLPFPLHDKVDRRGRFVGANDNGAGIAILMELGNELAKNPPKLGVDFVFFDGEEYIFKNDGKYFWGSEYFADEYVNHPPAFRYRYAVLMDIVGGENLQLSKESNSASWDDSGPLVKQIWDTAARLKVQEFVPWLGDPIRDDHLALHDVAKIPACDLIDLNYPQWHTQQDTPEHCSPLSMAKVGWVLQEWLRAQ